MTLSIYEEALVLRYNPRKLFRLRYMYIGSNLILCCIAQQAGIDIFNINTNI